MTGIDDLQKITDGIKKTMENLMPNVEKIMNETQKVLLPKSKKDVKINGINCSVSLTTDCRIIVNLPTEDLAKNLYDNIHLIQTKKSFWSKLFLK